MDTTSTALCHEWLTTFGGADQVAARLAHALSITEIYTYALRPQTASSLFPSARVEQIGPRWDLTNNHWQWFLPHMPRAWRRVDLDRFDVVVTSSHSCVNAVRPRSDALLISYCHTPMRYAWEWRTESRRLPGILRPLWPTVATRLRAADARWSQRVDLFIANSRFVADRIGRSYGKGSLVIHPPIDTDFWTLQPTDTEDSSYFLLSGRMVAYKRPDLVVDAARRAGVKLIVAGDGPMMPELRRRAARNVRFEVTPSSSRLRELYRQATAFVFAGTEDFGMSVVEAQACGTPVIAYADGGVLETVIPGETGLLLQDADVETFAQAMRTFRPGDFERDDIRRASLRFDTRSFDRSVRWAVSRAQERDWGSIEAHPAWMAASSI